MLPESPVLSSRTVLDTHNSSIQPSSPSPLKAWLSSSRRTSIKVVFVGNEGVGKTSFVRRFVSEELGIPFDEVTPTATSSMCSFPTQSPLHHLRQRRERPPWTISTGVQQDLIRLDIYELELPMIHEFSDETGTLPVESSNDDSRCGSSENLQRLSIWDFSGKPACLQSIQKLFFSPQTLYVVLWDMAVKDVTPLKYECAPGVASPTSDLYSLSADCHSQDTIKCNKQNDTKNADSNNNLQPQSQRSIGSSTFNLGYDSDSDSSDYDYYNDCDVDMYNQEELKVAKRKLEKDIDKNVQCWIDRIQAIAPGSTILPMATHRDLFRHKNINSDTATFTTDDYQLKEVKKRCWLFKERLISNEHRKVEVFKRSINAGSKNNGNDYFGQYLSRPNFQFGNVQKDGQVFPHAVITSFTYTEDIELDDSSINNICEYDHKESFSSAREYIVCKALEIAAGEKYREWHDGGRSELAVFPQNSSISIANTSIPASLATIMLQDVRRKLWRRSKIVQINYFTEKFDVGENYSKAWDTSIGGNQTDSNNNNSAVVAALKLLHLSGELCYFGGVIHSSGTQHQEQSSHIQLLSDFVVLDPTWLIESINFILQLTGTVDSRTMMKLSHSSNRYKASNFPVVDIEEVRRLWKSRYSTKQGLGLAEHYHQFQSSDKYDQSETVADLVFEFIRHLLLRHDVFVPFSLQKSASKHFLLPCLLHPKNACDSIITNPPPLSSLLLSHECSAYSNWSSSKHKGHTISQIDLNSANLRTACHGFVFVDTAPQNLMERIIVHTLTSLRVLLFSNCEPSIKPEEIYFWKDSFRLKLRVHVGERMKKKTITINSVLLEASGCDTASHFVTCESMLVTYFQGWNDSESQKLWLQTCLRLREAMENALDDMPGVEYREEGICPQCLRKKPISDTGTWTLSKLKSAINNKETSIRCRHGHRTETKLNGFLHCQLVNVPGEYLLKTNDKKNILLSTAGPSNSRSVTTSISCNNQSPHVSLGAKEAMQHIPLNVKMKKSDHIYSTPRQHTISTMSNNKRGIFTLTSLSNDRDAIFPENSSSTTHSNASIGRRSRYGKKKKDKENDRFLNTKSLHLLSRCKAKMEHLLLRKIHLDLENRNMTICQIPMKELNGTKFGNQLQSISLSYNKLETLPQSLVRCLPNLRCMNLSHCLIYELPKRWSLPALKKLDISHNLLIKFPEESMLLGLSELEELNLSDNKISEVEVSANPNILRKLRRLDLSSNDLTIFPICLNRFKALKSLELKCNHI